LDNYVHKVSTDERPAYAINLPCCISMHPKPLREALL
jgi:hypothetical protein